MVTVFNLCKKLIEKDKTDGLSEKLDVYYGCNRLTTEEYQQLVQMMGDSTSAAE